MKKLVIIIAVLLCLGSFNPGHDGETFKKLYVLEGTWKMNSKRGGIYEEWKKIDEYYLQSRGYMLKGADTVITERVALKNSMLGIFYVSTVEDQNDKQPVAFKMTKADDKMFVFENPQHDFPKRIVYRFVTADSLHAFIDDGTEEGKKQNFYYKRQ